MKIAVTYDNGEIFQHFGHTEQFKLYDIENGKVVASEVVGTNGSGHGALAGFLAEHQVQVLICGGIGGGAQNALAQAGIKLFGGCSGNADQAVEALLEGQLNYDADVKCSHHDHEHGERSPLRQSRMRQSFMPLIVFSHYRAIIQWLKVR